MTPARTLAALVRAGLAAVGCRIPVEEDGGTVAVRHLLVEFDGGITCLSAEDGKPREVFSMPADAVESAACAVVLRIVSGIVSREVESAHAALIR